MKFRDLRIPSAAILLVLFFSLLILFSQNRYYRPARLVVTGIYQSPVEVDVTWRSGNKRLPSERVTLVLGKAREAGPQAGGPNGDKVGGGDSYEATDSVDIPQLKVNKLTVAPTGNGGLAPPRLTSLRIVSADGSTLAEPPVPETFPITIRKVYRLTRAFHPVLFGVQVALSAAMDLKNHSVLIY